MSSPLVQSDQPIHSYDLSKVVELPFELRLMILEAAANIDLRTAIAVSQVDRRCNAFAKGPQSGMHDILKIDGLRALLDVARRLRSGAIDGRRVKGVFLVNVRGEGFGSREECEASCTAMEEVYKRAERRHPYGSSQGSEKMPACIAILAFMRLLEKCKGISAWHYWEPSSALSIPELSEAPVIAWPLQYLKRCRVQSTPEEISLPGSAVCPSHPEALPESLRSLHIAYPRLDQRLSSLLATHGKWTRLRLTRPLATATETCGWLIALSGVSHQSQAAQLVILELDYDVPAEEVETLQTELAEKQTASSHEFKVVILHHSLGNTSQAQDGWSQNYFARQLVRSVYGEDSWWSTSDRREARIEAKKE